MARRRKERSLGEMISTVCFYLVGVYFIFEGALAGLSCLLGGARFLIADLVVQVKTRRR
jgi:hypothetical protein